VRVCGANPSPKALSLLEPAERLAGDPVVTAPLQIPADRFGAERSAGFSHAFRVGVTAPGHARARPGSNDRGPGRDSPAGQLIMLANMPGS
jgi:hypothetical protein